MSIHAQAVEVISRVIADAGPNESLMPSLVAERVFEYFKTEGVPLEIEWAAREHFKQMARRQLARHFDADSDDNPAHQGEMFSGQLQVRYPVPRGSHDEEPTYKPRALLTIEELDWNIQALRKSASARLQHADALQAWRKHVKG